MFESTVPQASDPKTLVPLADAIRFIDQDIVAVENTVAAHVKRLFSEHNFPVKMYTAEEPPPLPLWVIKTTVAWNKAEAPEAVESKMRDAVNAIANYVLFISETKMNRGAVIDGALDVRLHEVSKDVCSLGLGIRFSVAS
jgi:hypothetical protein